MRRLEDFQRFVMMEGATPIQRLERLERELGEALGGVRLFVKRDDLTGLGGGGGHLRKLEFLMGDALERGCDTFITTGDIQSNHARLSAAAAARAGLCCELALTRLVPRQNEEYRRNGNVLLDGLFGARVHELSTAADATAFAEQRAAALTECGRRPYLVVSGGSSPLGCLGYAACALEIAAQEEAVGFTFARIVVPNGSAGIHAGLAAALAATSMFPARIRSFAVMLPAVDARRRTLDLARQTLSLLDQEASIESCAIDVADGQLGDGYGIPTPAMFAAVRLMARAEGLLLDPVSGGKAFAGVLADVRNGTYQAGNSVLFVMTGGVPGLFAYRPAFDPQYLRSR
jgi:L-cysteate sulfo-lyase